MSNRRKFYAGLWMALMAGFALSACATPADSPADEAAIGEATQAVTVVPGGTKIACTMSGPTVTGRRWGFLVVDMDQNTCYRFADPARFNEPAPVAVAHCGQLGHQIQCGVILDQ